MIVCSCNVLRERQLREAARGGAQSEREAYAHLGCKPQCGRCLCYARELVNEELAQLAA